MTPSSQAVKLSKCPEGASQQGLKIQKSKKNQKNLKNQQ